ncbi:MAG: 23S rRNA (adenine(2503)-C(2))-methyltransferase RlmN [Bacteroidota bacterium]
MTSQTHHLLQKLPVDLYRLPLGEWDTFFRELGLKPETQKQVFEALYHGDETDIMSMTGLDARDRDILSRAAVIQCAHKQELKRSGDGSYRLTLRLHDGYLAETVIIPEWKDGKLRKCTASISSQIGCFFGCSFCATGRMGFHRNLSTGELLDQVRIAESVVRDEIRTGLSHLYFMGMGEPMHNYRAISDALAIMRDKNAPGPPPPQITVSTVGLFRQIRMLAADHPGVRLAVSIHSADQRKRYEIMPVSSRLQLPDIREALVFHQRQTGYPSTIQYLMMKGINDGTEDARNLTAFLGDLYANITLIMYNDVPDAGMQRTGLDRIQSFRTVLADAGFPVDIRWCYGEDIEAGCGQLKAGCEQDQATHREERIKVSMRHGSPIEKAHRGSISGTPR